MSLSPKSTRIRFAPFTLDPGSRELWRDGQRVPLPPQPARVLLVLLRRPGEVVTRRELAELLWPDRHVEVDPGLNSCIRQLRRVLGDSATEPLYIETLPRIGYRFLGAVEAPEESSHKEDGRRGQGPGVQSRPERGLETPSPKFTEGAAVPMAGGSRRGLVVVTLCMLLAILGAGTLPQLLHLEVHVGTAEASFPPRPASAEEAAPASLHRGDPFRRETPCFSGAGRRQPTGAERKPGCPGPGLCEDSSAAAEPAAPSIQIVVRLPPPPTGSLLENEDGTGGRGHGCRGRQGLARRLLAPLERWAPSFEVRF